jgi:hypothetical protein
LGLKEITLMLINALYALILLFLDNAKGNWFLKKTKEYLSLVGVNVYQRKKTLHKICVICGVHFDTNKPNKVVCNKEGCRLKLKRQNAKANYYVLKAKPGKFKCPMCEKFKSFRKYCYCDKCRQKLLKWDEYSDTLIEEHRIIY